VLIHRAYKFRLYPDKAQACALAKHFGCRRFVYNHFLEVRRDHYQQHGQGLSYTQTCKRLTALKRDPDRAWLTEVNAQSLQQALRDLDTAFRNFFAGRAGYPHFKHKRGGQSFRVPQSFRVAGDRLVIPKASLPSRWASTGPSRAG
jgi:putative transposase